MNQSLAQVLKLRKEIRGCTRCRLHLACRSPVPFYGPVPCEIAVLAEAPGKTEDNEGRPMIGPAGQLLRRAMKKVGIDPAEVFFFNAASCYPGREPKPDEILACAGNRMQQLRLAQPRYLIVAGNVALRTVRKDLSIGMVRGRPLHLGKRGWTEELFAWPIYHPAAALGGRNPTYVRHIEEDLTKFLEWKAAGEEWTLECVKCKGDVDYMDELGLCWCMRHLPKHLQGKLVEVEATGGKKKRRNEM